MGIHTRFERIQVAERRRLADDLLSRVIVDHVSMRHREVQVVNRAIVGMDVPYTVTVNGVVVSSGVGELLAPQVRTAVRDLVVRQTRTIPTVKVAVAFLFTAAMLATLMRSRQQRNGEADPLVWIARRLWERSPVVSGEYRDNHILYADGVEVGTAADVIAGLDIPEAKVYAFANTVPYSRKIEVGVTKDGRDFVIQVPNRIYERTGDEAGSKFAADCDIEFTMQGVVGGNMVSQALAHSYGQPWWLGDATEPRAASGLLETRIAKKFGKTAHNRSGRRFPTIIVRYR
jgi:hypothetical protein